MSKEKKKKLTLKNFKGTPRKFNDNSVKTQGKVVVERKNPNFKPSNNNLEKKTIQKAFAPKINPPSGNNQKKAKKRDKKKI